MKIAIVGTESRASSPHTNTVRIDTPSETHWVDTGFIVSNDRNYPRFERPLRLGGRPALLPTTTNEERASNGPLEDARRLVVEQLVGLLPRGADHELLRQLVRLRVDSG